MPYGITQCYLPPDRGDIPGGGRAGRKDGGRASVGPNHVSDVQLFLVKFSVLLLV